MSVLDSMSKGRQEVKDTGILIGEDSFGDDYPGIFELLTRVSYQGKARKAGRLILYAEQNRATLVLCDVEDGNVTFYASESFGEALEGLEKALQAGSCDWRRDKRSRFQK
jgi:hypothetical protein